MGWLRTPWQAGHCQHGGELMVHGCKSGLHLPAAPTPMLPLPMLLLLLQWQWCPWQWAKVSVSLWLGEQHFVCVGVVVVM